MMMSIPTLLTTFFTLYFPGITLVDVQTTASDNFQNVVLRGCGPIFAFPVIEAWYNTSNEIHNKLASEIFNLTLSSLKGPFPFMF